MPSLRKLRGNKTLIEISKATDIDSGNLSRIERGIQMPSRESAKALAKHYELSETEIFQMCLEASDNKSNAA